MPSTPIGPLIILSTSIRHNRGPPESEYDEGDFVIFPLPVISCLDKFNKSVFETDNTYNNSRPLE